MKLAFVSLSLVLAIVPQTIGLRFSPSGGGGGGAILQQSDITWTGVKGVAGGGLADDEFNYGGMSGRQVAGTNHFFAFLNQVGTAGQYIISGTSTTQFTLATGKGADYVTGEKIHIQRAARGAGGVPGKEVLPENSVVTNISGDVLTISPAIGGIPVNNDYAYRDRGGAIAEYVDSGGSWTTGGGGTTPDPLTANNFTTATVYHDPWNGKKGSWGNVDHLWSALAGDLILPAGLYWNESKSLLYAAFFDAYNVSGNHDWNLLAIDISAGGGATTTYGPWRTQASNTDGTWYGPERCLFMAPDPADSSKMSCGSAISSGATHYPWGPDEYNGLTWPDAGTTVGYSAPNLDFGSTRSLEYYFMGGSISSVGQPTATMRAYSYFDTTFNYVWEDESESSPINNVNRIYNSNKNSWNELNRTNGWLDFRGIHKKGVIFVSGLVGLLNGDTASCAGEPFAAVGAHEWYASPGQGRATLTGISGTFLSGDTITDGSKSASVLTWDGSLMHWSQNTAQCGGGCDASSNLSGHITATPSGASGTIATWSRQDHCFHGCTEGPISSTGPSLNYVPIHPNLIIYNPDDLDAVRAGSVPDYSPQPQAQIDLITAYPGYLDSVRPGGGTYGMYLDPVANDFYLVCHLCDARGAPSLYTDYFYRFHINDAATPEPTLMSWLWSLAPEWLKSKTKPHAIPTLLERPR